MTKRTNNIQKRVTKKKLIKNNIQLTYYYVIWAKNATGFNVLARTCNKQEN